MSNAVTFEAYKFIVENGIDTLPITRDDLVDIAKRHKWKLCGYNLSGELRDLLKLQGVDTDEYIKTKDAFAVMLKDEYIIFFKDSLSLEQKVFVILHEYAHIALRHTCYGIMGKSPDKTTTDIQEAEADEFARTVCAPLPVLYQCRVRSSKDIERYGLLTGTEANAQFISLSKIDSQYGLDNLEKEITRIFNSFIQGVKLMRIRSAAKRYLPIAVVALIIGMLAMSPFVINNGHNPTLNEPTSNTQPAIMQNSPAPVPLTETVYVTRTGEKYHVEGCQYIEGKDNLRDMTAEEAEQAGYEPCSVCIR